MNERLTAYELAALIARAFRPGPADRALAILVDLPDQRVADTPNWRARREMAAQWAEELSRETGCGLAVHLVLYRHAGANNADLPAQAVVSSGGPLPCCAEELDTGLARPFSEILAAHQIVLAPTEFSATAPLKVAARQHAFRAATMPGFTSAMIPALRLDYGEVHRRVLVLKHLLDRATETRFVFEAEGREHLLTLDLRYRQAHASSGLLLEPGTAGNLPSGESYIVPYEGERQGEPSQSRGSLPVQLGDDVVIYEIEENRARAVHGGGEVARTEATRLAHEPAYGNLAELGLGVLGELGIEPIGETLLDEKLGLHIAFGRSDHFGGQVGAKDFSRPEAVVHIDRVYVPRIQPRVVVRAVELLLDDGVTQPLMRDGRYVVDFSASGPVAQ